MLELLREAVDADGQTTVMVTHDPPAAATADRVLFLADGRIVGDLDEPGEDRIIDVMRAEARPVIRLALRSLAARPLRTALTALAVVLGVAMVSAAFTITDTMRGAADSLSRAAYDGTDAVVGARTAFAVDAGDWTAKRPTVDAGARDRVRAVPASRVAAADITDEAKVIGRDGKPDRRRPVLRRRARRADAGRRRADAVPPLRRPLGRRAGEVVIDTGMAADEDRPVGSTVTVTTRGEPHDFRVVGTADFGSVESMGTATFAVFDLDAAADAVRARRPGGRDPRRRL